MRRLVAALLASTALAGGVAHAQGPPEPIIIQPPGKATPAGSNTQVQFNCSAALCGASGLTYNPNTSTATLPDGSTVSPSGITTGQPITIPAAWSNPAISMTMANSQVGAGIEVLNTSTSNSPDIEIRGACGSPPSFTPVSCLPGDGVPAILLAIHKYNGANAPGLQIDGVRDAAAGPLFALKNSLNLITAPLPTASFTGSISGTTLTIPGAVTGYVETQQPLDDVSGNLAAGTVVTGQLAGPAGCTPLGGACTSGAGSGSTYSVNNSQTVGSEAMTALGAGQQGTEPFLQFIGYGGSVLGVSGFKVITGGVGCTPGVGTTFTLNGGTHSGPFLAAQANFTVSGGGTISGNAPTGTQGNYTGLPANDGTATLAGGGCVTPPTVKFWPAQAGGIEGLLSVGPNLSFLAPDPLVVPTWFQPMIIEANSSAINPTLQVENAATSLYAGIFSSISQGIDIVTTGTLGHTLSLDAEGPTNNETSLFIVNKTLGAYAVFNNGSTNLFGVANNGYVGIGSAGGTFALSVQSPGAGQLFQSTGANDNVTELDNAAGGQNVLEEYMDGGLIKYLVGKTAANGFEIKDNATSAMAFSIVSSAVSIGEAATVTTIAGSSVSLPDSTSVTSTGFQGPIGATTPAAGAFTTLAASSTVSGTGFSTYLASPPAIGGSSPAAGAFTTLSATGALTMPGSAVALAYGTNGSLCGDASGFLEIGASGSCGTGGGLVMGSLFASAVSNTGNNHAWILGAVAPAVSSGLGTSPAVTANGTAAFKIVVGATGSPSTAEVLTMPSGATNGWSCSAYDLTTPAKTAVETATGATTVTETWNTAPLNSDVLTHLCMAF